MANYFADTYEEDANPVLSLFGGAPPPQGGFYNTLKGGQPPKDNYFARTYTPDKTITEPPPAPPVASTVPDVREQQRLAARADNADNTFVENLARGVAAGVTGRGVGLYQTAFDIGKAPINAARGIVGLPPSETIQMVDDSLAGTASRVKNWSEGTKVGGFIGELADPANLIIAGPGNLAIQAAKAGAISAGTAPSERPSSLGSRATNAAVGAGVGGTVGATAPMVAKPVGAVLNKLVEFADRALVMAGNKLNAAERVVLKQAVSDALDSGLTPEQVLSKIDELNKVAPGRSVAEALQVPKMFARERNVYQSNTPSARQFMDQINTSNANVLRPEAAALREGFDKADPLYTLAEKEYRAAKLLEDLRNQPEMVHPRVDPYGVTPPHAVDPSKFSSQTGDALRASSVTLPEAEAAASRIPETAADEEIARLLSGVEGRMNNLSVNGQMLKGDPEAAVLPLIQQRLQLASDRGMGFKDLQQLRQQLRSLFIDGADEATASRANKISRGVADDVGSTLTQRAPSLAEADAQFRRGLKGKELTEMLDNAEGNLATLKGKFPAAGEERRAFLEAIPAGEREKVATAITTAESLARTGYGAGIKTPRTGQLARVADESTLGGDTGLLNAMGFLQKIARHVGEKIQPDIYRAQADLSLGGNNSASKIAEAMRTAIEKDARGRPIGRAINKAVSGESAQGVTSTGPYNPNNADPQNNLTPIANALLNVFGAQELVAPKKPRNKKPTKITISPDAAIGPDGLPRVNLPKANFIPETN